MNNGKNLVIEKAQPKPKRTYRPVGCLVALYLYPARPLSAGLVMPDSAQGMSSQLYEAQRCLVIAAGPDCKWVKEGDEVLCVQGAQQIVHLGERTVLTKEEYLAGVVEDEFRVEPRAHAYERAG